MAAATTSLPETPGGERNWDYRYSWIRDSTFALWGLYTLGFDWEANDYLYFIADVAERDDELQVMYGVDGERRARGADPRPPQRLRGRAAGPHRQRRVRAAAARHVGRGARLGLPPHEVARPPRRAYLADPGAPGRGGARALARAGPRASGRSAASRSTSPPRRSCAGSPPTAARGWRACARTTELAERWQAAADEIHADICANGVDKRGVFTQHYETEALDASLLLMPLVRFLPPDDERIRRTVLAIADELTDDGLVLRYRTEETDDGLSGAEGTFTICSFWLVSALVEIGERDARAAAVREAALVRQPLGLYGEELDPDTGRHLGNFPQAFTHLALINAVMHVIRAERGDVPARRSPLAAAARPSPGTPTWWLRPGHPPARCAAGARGVRRGNRHSSPRMPRPFRFLADAREVATIRQLTEYGSPAPEAIGIDTLVVPDHLIEQLAPIGRHHGGHRGRLGPGSSDLGLRAEQRPAASRRCWRRSSRALDMLLSEGRLDVAIGAGWNRAEDQAIGVDDPTWGSPRHAWPRRSAVLKGCFGNWPCSASPASTTRSAITTPRA